MKEINKEAYVSFKIAELLKDKGFNWECRSFYEYFSSMITMYQGMLPELSEAARNYNKEEYKDICSRPTQQMACSWLREVHKIDISVTPDDGSWWIKVTELESWSGVFNDKVLNSDDIKYAYKGDTSTKESCYEAALQYVLTELI